MIIILLSSFLLGRSYSKYLDKGLGELEGFLELLVYMRGKVVCYLEPAFVWQGGFSNEWLERCGFIPALRENGSLRGAYKAVHGRLSVPNEAEKVLSDFFSRTGKGYLDSEIKNLDYTVERLDKLCERMRTGLPGRRRVMNASLTALGLGLAILVI